MSRSLDSELAELMFEFSMSCCGRTWGWPGKPNPRAAYICKTCKKEMVVTTTQIRSEEEARYIIENRGKYKGEVCPDCGNRTSWTFRWDDEDVCFLICGHCGTEMFEITEETDETQSGSEGA